MRPPHIEILYFRDCPNFEQARALVERVAAELRVPTQIELVEVPDTAAAIERCFLGSPTVRVDGRDVEPGADARRDFALSCRVYPSGDGFGGRPQEAWIRQALSQGRA